MAAPPKPWERVGVNFQNSVSIPSNSMAGPALGGGDSLQDAVGNVGGASPLQTTSLAPPQPPPRPTQQSSSSPYASRFGGGGYSGYGGYGGGHSSFSNPYSFGGMGGGMYSSPYSSYGSYGSPHNANSLFARQAEESSRPAFESIESIVHAVSSVGMMLDSTFSAVYSSFRAVIGVADNFARLKSQLVQVFSALAFIRTLRYMIRKLLELLRLRPKGEAEAEWRKAFNAATAAAASSTGGGEPKKSSWPILMFFGIIMGGPYLIWKLISKFSGQEESGWAAGQEDHFVAKANYNFQGQGSEELSFNAGQEIRIAPKELQPRVRGWLLASLDGSTTGLIPANHVTIRGKKRGSQHQDQQQDNLVQTVPNNNSAPTPTFPSPSSVSNIQQMTPAIHSESDRDFDAYFSGPTGQSPNVADSAFDELPPEREAVDILEAVDK